MSQAEFDALRTSTLRLNRRGELLGLLAGVGFGLAVGRPWNSSFDFPTAISWIIVSNTLMFGILGWLMYTAAESGVAMSRFFKAPVSVDLFRPGALMPIAQWSVGVASIFMGGIAVSMVFLTVEALRDADTLIIYGVLFSVSLAFFFFNLRETHRVLSQAKQEKAGAVKERIIEIAEGLDRSLRLGNRSETHELSVEMSGLVGYQQQVKGAPTWPFNTAVIRGLLIASLVPTITILARVLPQYLI